VASLERRLEALEDARTRRANQLAREALTYLSDEDLDALEEFLVVGQENAGERGRRAVMNLNDVHEALREGKKPQKGVDTK
jgi:hypothetical protein